MFILSNRKYYNSNKNGQLFKLLYNIHAYILHIYIYMIIYLFNII